MPPFVPIAGPAENPGHPLGSTHRKCLINKAKKHLCTGKAPELLLDLKKDIKKQKKLDSAHPGRDPDGQAAQTVACLGYEKPFDPSWFWTPVVGIDVCMGNVGALLGC